MSIAIDGGNLGNVPWLKTCSMTYRTIGRAAPEHRCGHSTSGSTRAAATDSEGI